MEFPQSTIGQIIDSEREMVLTAPQRYGKYYQTALDCSVLHIGMPRLGFDWHTRVRPIGSEELAASIAPIMS
jgi:catechol 2,3-dioxygenase-like lactoylglutathione lyase family enzyme